MKKLWKIRRNLMYELFLGQRDTTNSSECMEGNGQLLSGYPVPDELLIAIFQNLPDVCLIQVVPRVCRHWHSISGTWHLWKKRLSVCEATLSPCRLDRILALWESDPKARVTVQWLCLRGHRILSRNLLKNPSGQEGLNHWKVQHGGDGVVVEEPPVGSDPLPPEAGLPSQHCFVSSYSQCKRQQSVFLRQKDQVLSFALKLLQPDLVISEWVCARFDCGAKSQVEVIAKGDHPSQGVEVYKITWRDTENDRIKWHKMMLRVPYEKLPPGLRSFTFKNVSQDTQFWAGHYGAKTAGSSLVLDITSDE